MPNRALFATKSTAVPRTDAVNEAGGRAYTLPPMLALAQYAATGCFNGTFYAGAEAQFDTVLHLAEAVEPLWVAKTAIYAHEQGRMRDMPALLLAILSRRDPALFTRVFPRVVGDARTLRAFVQIMRSGQAGRRSLGSAPKHAVRVWLEARGDEDLFNASVGQQPSLSDIIKMVHPRPRTPEREALYGHLIGKDPGDGASALLPEVVRAYEAFKANPQGDSPSVRFEMLAGLPLDAAGWRGLARRATWQQTRINLNTFARHGVFDEPGMAEEIAVRLADPEAIRRARALPYQLLAAHLNVGAGVPEVVRQALGAAADAATANVPVAMGKVFVLLDVSGSMDSPVTGVRAGATSKITCRQTAALMAASIVRRNPEAEVIAFHTEALDATHLVHGTVLEAAAQLATLPSGGTDCAAPLRLLNARAAHGGLVVMVSDNQSWAQTWRAAQRPGTGVMQEWAAFRSRNPEARLACIDIQPYGTAQAPDRADVLNVGGFSDAVFDVLAQFGAGDLAADHWSSVIDAIEV